MSERASRIGVVGGGLGGLAAACTLAARGHQVVLFERNDWLGGKNVALDREGFRFDMGPTILTLPSVLRRIFSEAGRDLDDALQLIRLDPQWRSFFVGGSTLDLWSDAGTMSRAISDFSSPRDAAGYERFLEHSERLHEISDRYYFWRPIGGLRDMFQPSSALSIGLLRDLLAMRPDRSVASLVRAYARDPRLAQMLDHFTQYVGSAPNQSPAVLCGIAHMQTQEGVWYPLGGMAGIASALAGLAVDLNVEIRARTPIRRIVIDDGGVRGVITAEGEAIPLAAVVSNADAVRTHRELIGGKIARRFDRRRKYEPACSGVVLYLGLNRRYEHLAHHNFVFSRDPEAEFHDIYRRGVPAKDPTCYVCAPAATDPNVAPPGGEALYVLVHAPYLRPDHNWAEMFPAYRDTIIRKLADVAGLEQLEERIVCEDWLTPQDIHNRYRVLNGAIYGLASHGRWRGGFKPSNLSPDVRGLYLCGGAAHPGPGVPMVLMSGWIAADALDSEARLSHAPRLAPEAI